MCQKAVLAGGYCHSAGQRLMGQSESSAADGAVEDEPVVVAAVVVF